MEKVMEFEELKGVGTLIKDRVRRKFVPSYSKESPHRLRFSPIQQRSGLSESPMSAVPPFPSAQ